MSTLGDVVVRLRANISDLRRNMDEARNHLRDFQREVRETTRQYKAIGEAGAKAGAALVATLGVLGGLGVKYNADMERATTSFQTLLGSAEAAKSMLADLQQFAANTPYEFPGVQESAKLMLAMGFNAKAVMPSLQALGDAVAAIGGNEDTLNGVTLAIGQMMTKGKISAEEMNQLAERGIAGWEIMAQAMGKSKAELMDMAAQGELMADVALPKLIEGMQQKYKGAMDAQSKTFYGMLSTLRDNIMMTLGQISAPAFDKIKEGFADLLETIAKFKADGTLDRWTTQVTNAFNTVWAIAVAVGKVFVAVASQIAEHWVIIGPVIAGVVTTLGTLFIIGTIAKLWGLYAAAVRLVTASMTALNAAFLANPIGIIARALGFLVGVVYALRIAWVNNMGGIQQKTYAVAGAIVAYWNMAVKNISFAFNALKAAVYNLLQGIMNSLAPVVGLIGKMAPGFEAGFERLRSVVNDKTSDINLKLKEMGAEAAEATKGYVKAGKGVARAFSSWDGAGKSLASVNREFYNTNKELDLTGFNFEKLSNAADAAGAVVEGAGEKAREGAEDTRTAWEKTADAISAKMAALQAQYELAGLAMDRNATEAQKLQRELTFLEQKYALQQKVVEQAKAAYESLAKSKGMTSKETVDAANTYAQEAKSLSELATQISDTSLALQKMSWETDAVKSTLEVLNAEQEKAVANLDESAGKTAELNIQNKFLNEKYKLQADLIADLEREYKATAQAKGKDAEETRKAYLELLKAQTEQGKLAREIRETNKAIADQVREFQELSIKVSDTSKKYREDLAKAAEDYYNKVHSVNEKLRDDEQKLRDDFNKTLEDRAKSLADFVGLFEQVKNNDVTGTDLLGYLTGQVYTFKQWQQNLSSLAEKGIDEGLLKELEDMGPKAAGEIAALNTLTGSELEQYVSLWQEKQRLAKDVATQELDGLRVETQQKIGQLRSDAAAQLEQYRQEWINTNQFIRIDTEKELQSIVDSAEKLGAEMVQKLAASIRASMPELAGALSGLGNILGQDQGGGQVQAAENQSKNVVTAAQNMGQGVVDANTLATQTTLQTWQQASQQMHAFHQQIEAQTLTVWTDLQNRLAALWAKMLQDLTKTWSDMKKFFFDTITAVESRFDGLIGKAYNWGISLISEFIRGIRGQFSKLEETLTEMAELVNSYMPHSPAKRGPLSTLDETGPGLVRTFADGITASVPYLKRVVGNMAGAAIPTVGVAGARGEAYNGSDTLQGGNNFVINITGANAEEIWEQLERQLTRRGVRF